VIFRDDADRREILHRLLRILTQTRTRCFAWALMPNHFHLLLKTEDVLLARVMQRLNTGYAKYFNERYDRVGHLFQNRYGSVRVDAEAQFDASVCYLHLNPLRAGLVADVDALETYRWTGHAALMGARRCAFLDGATVLARYGGSIGEAREALKSLMKRLAERPQLPEPAESARPAFDQLHRAVCAEFGLRDLRSSGRSMRATEARAVLAWLARDRLSMSASEIAREVGVSHPTISRAMRLGAALLCSRPGLRKLGE